MERRLHERGEARGGWRRSERQNVKDEGGIYEMASNHLPYFTPGGGGHAFSLSPTFQISPPCKIPAAAQSCLRLCELGSSSDETQMISWKTGAACWLLKSGGTRLPFAGFFYFILMESGRNISKRRTLAAIVRARTSYVGDFISILCEPRSKWWVHVTGDAQSNQLPRISAHIFSTPACFVVVVPTESLLRRTEVEGEAGGPLRCCEWIF